MKFSFLQKKLKPTWRFKPPARFKIWKVFPTKYDKILCELRDIEKKQIKFICLSIENGNCIWENLNIDRPWWIQISDSDENIFFLCEYKRPDLPIQSKTYAINSETGEIIWNNEEYNFLFALNGKVYMVKNLIDQRTFLEFDLKTGKLTQEFDEKAEIIKALKEMKLKSMKYIETSSPLDEIHPNYEEILEKISPFIENANMQFAPEVLVKRNYVIISYHKTNCQRFPLESKNSSNVLKVIDLNEKSLVYEDVLYSDLSYLVPDTFFCKDDFLFYIKNQDELIAIKLP